MDLEALRRILLSNALFVVQPRSNLRFVFKEELADNGQGSNIVGDYVVELVGKKSKGLYPDDLRFIRAVDPEPREIIDFITNNFELSALDISNIYQHRWDIEVLQMDQAKHCHQGPLGIFPKRGQNTSVDGYLCIPAVGFGEENLS